MKIGIIAGEVSGDQLGGWLMHALKQLNPAIEWIGVGGESMQREGLKSLFPMQDIALMGVFEILPHITTISKRLRETIHAIETAKPDILITIDSPGFCTRIVKALRKNKNHRPRFIHYVAPSVWSHRPERAKKFAILFDQLLVLFPFEPPYFKREGLPTIYVGHEVAWQWREKADGAVFRARHSIAQDAPLLALFPGSRQGELRRMLPAFRGALERLTQTLPALRSVIQVPPSVLAYVKEATKKWPHTPIVLSSAQDKKELFAAATAALSKSGTVALECAFAGLPLVVTYRANPISVALVRRLLTIKYVHIANYMADCEIIPELLQERCTPDALYEATLPLLQNPTLREKQRNALANFASLLGAADAVSPSHKAAAAILNAV